jgi:nudix-type nucleoside diphosphatase (YffH/AdpP family)
MTDAPPPPEILAVTSLHRGWTELLSARIRLGDGTEIAREILRHGRAAVVLPYDPVRRTAILVRQLRPAVLLVGGDAILAEAPAGMVDDETPEAAARREAMEEAGLQLGDLEHVATAWASPGLTTERIDLYLAACRPADRIGPGGGAEGENEGIVVEELPLAECWAMASDGRIADLKTLTLLFALRVRRPELFD